MKLFTHFFLLLLLSARAAKIVPTRPLPSALYFASKVQLSFKSDDESISVSSYFLSILNDQAATPSLLSSYSSFQTAGSLSFSYFQAISVLLLTPGQTATMVVAAQECEAFVFQLYIGLPSIATQVVSNNDYSFSLAASGGCTADVTLLAIQCDDFSQSFQITGQFLQNSEPLTSGLLAATTLRNFYPHCSSGFCLMSQECSVARMYCDAGACTLLGSGEVVNDCSWLQFEFGSLWRCNTESTCYLSNLSNNQDQICTQDCVVQCPGHTLCSDTPYVEIFAVSISEVTPPTTYAFNFFKIKDFSSWESIELRHFLAAELKSSSLTFHYFTNNVHLISPSFSVATASSAVIPSSTPPMRNGYQLRTPQLASFLLDPWSRAVLFPLVIDSISTLAVSSVTFSNSLTNAWLTTAPLTSEDVAYSVTYIDGNVQQSSSHSFAYSAELVECTTLVASPSNFLTLAWSDFYPIHRSLRFINNATHCTEYEHRAPIITPSWISEESLAYALQPGVLTVDPKYVAKYLGPGDSLSFSITPVYLFQGSEITAQSSLDFHISVSSVDYVHYHFDYPLHIIGTTGSPPSTISLTPQLASRWGPSLYQISWDSCSVQDCSMSSSTSRVNHTLSLSLSSLPISPTPVFYDSRFQQHVQTSKYSRIPTPSISAATTLTSLTWKIGVHSLPLSRALGFDLWIELADYPDLTDSIYSDGTYTFAYTVSLLTTDQYMAYNNHLYIYPVFNLRQTIGTELTIDFSVTTNSLTETASLTIVLTGSWGSDFTSAGSVYESGKTAYSQNAKISAGNAAFPFTSNLIYETWCVESRLVIYRVKSQIYGTYDPTFSQRWPDTCTANYEMRACTQIGECVSQTINALSLNTISSFLPSELHHRSSYFLFSHKIASLSTDSLAQIVQLYISDSQQSWLQGLATPYKCGALRCINPLKIELLVAAIESVPLSSLPSPLIAHASIYNALATYISQIWNTFLHGDVPLAIRYYYFSRIRTLFVEVYGALDSINDSEVSQAIVEFSDYYLWMLPFHLPTPLHPTYPLTITTVSCALWQTVVDNTQTVVSDLSLSAGPFVVTIPASALNVLEQSASHYVTIASIDSGFISVNNSEQSLSTFGSVLILEARREVLSDGTFVSQNRELGVVFETIQKISISVSGITEPIGPLARYDEDTSWWRVLNITEAASHDPTNGVYAYELPKYGKYAFLSSTSPLIVPVDTAVTDTNYLYFFTNIELVRSEYSSEEIVPLLEAYFLRVRNISLKDSIDNNSIISKRKLQSGIIETVTGLCIILRECQINSSSYGILNSYLTSALIDSLADLFSLLASSFLSLPVDIVLPDDSSFLDSQYSSYMSTLLQFMKEYEAALSSAQITSLNLSRQIALQGCALFIASGETRQNSDSQFVKVSAYKGSGQESKSFINSAIASQLTVMLPSSTFESQERSFVVIFKKPDKWMDGFSIIGSQLVQIKVYTSSGEEIELESLEEGKRIVISIYDYGVQSCTDLEMRYWDEASSLYKTDGIYPVESTAPLCSFQTSHLSEFAVGVILGNLTITNITQITHNQILPEAISAENIFAVSTLVVFTLVILVLGISEDVRKCAGNKKEENPLTQEGRADLLPPSFCIRWWILILLLNSFLSFFTVRRRFFLATTQGLVLILRLWFISTLVSAAFLTSEPALLISLYYLVLLFLRPLGIFILNLKFTIIYNPRNNRVDPIESAVISEEALTSPSKAVATSTHRLHIEDTTQPDAVGIQKNDDKNSESSNPANGEKMTPPNEPDAIQAHSFQSIGNAPLPRPLSIPRQLRKNELLQKAVFLPLLVLILIVLIISLSSILRTPDILGKQIGYSWMMYLSFVFLLEPLLFLIAVQLIGKQLLRRRTKVAHFLIQMILGPKNLTLLSQRLG